MTTHTFDFGQYRIKAVERRYGVGEARSYRSKTRVYGAIDALSSGTSAELDRRTTKEAKLKLTALLGAMSDVFGRTPEVQTFSAKAGCSCGCSPGFILTSTLMYEGRTVDLFIERK